MSTVTSVGVDCDGLEVLDTCVAHTTNQLVFQEYTSNVLLLNEPNRGRTWMPEHVIEQVGPEALGWLAAVQFAVHGDLENWLAMGRSVVAWAEHDVPVHIIFDQHIEKPAFVNQHSLVYGMASEDAYIYDGMSWRPSPELILALRQSEDFMSHFVAVDNPCALQAWVRLHNQKLQLGVRN